MPAKGHRTIRVCAGGCGRKTRPGNVKIEAAPGTVVRRANGKCDRCYRYSGDTVEQLGPSSIRLCAGDCGRLTRGAYVRKELAPETVVRVKDGKCKVCLNRESGWTTNQPRPMRVIPITDSKISQARQDLESWLEKWRVRHARAIRREAIASGQLQAGQGRQMVLQRPGSERRDSRPVGGLREAGERSARSSSAA